MLRRTCIPLLAVPLLLAGCDVLGPVCTTDVRPAISILVLDSLTNGPPEAAGEVIARDGAYADTARLSDPLPDGMARASLVWGRRGRYTVEVDVSGYARWVVDDVRVGETDDGCHHVDTQSLTALLQRVAG